MLQVSTHKLDDVRMSESMEVLDFNEGITQRPAFITFHDLSCKHDSATLDFVHFCVHRHANRCDVFEGHLV
jgi:hypothetical protein